VTGGPPSAPPLSSGPGGVGGLLLAPRPGQTQASGADSSAPDPAGGTAAGDLSPRAADAGKAASTDAVAQSPEAAGALPGELSLAELFPSEAAIGAAAPDGAPASGVAPLVQGGQVGDDTGRSSPSRLPLVAGLIVTLAILIFGGGFLWWRNLDSKYWPC